MASQGGKEEAQEEQVEEEAAEETLSDMRPTGMDNTSFGSLGEDEDSET